MVKSGTKCNTNQTSETPKAWMHRSYRCYKNQSNSCTGGNAGPLTIAIAYLKWGNVMLSQTDIENQIKRDFTPGGFRILEEVSEALIVLSVRCYECQNESVTNSNITPNVK